LKPRFAIRTAPRTFRVALTGPVVNPKMAPLAPDDFRDRAPGAMTDLYPVRIGAMVSKELLEILVCPKCKKPVQQAPAAAEEPAQAWLVCGACRLRYPIRDNIPIMLIEEAQPMAGQAG